MKLQFNLSPSSISLYRKSQLQFYYQYILKRTSDTKVVQCYGSAGQVVHHVLEEYAKDKRIDYKEMFDRSWANWQGINLNSELGLNGKPLSQFQYFMAVKRGVEILDKYDNFRTEERLEFPLIDNKKALIKIKGYIDLQILHADGNITILDWKTSSKVDTAPDFKNQLIHYAYSVWRKYNIVANKFVIEYVKIGQTKEYDIQFYEIKNYETKLKELSEEIIAKGSNIKNYEEGEWNNIFNSHKKACLIESNNRLNYEVFNIVKKGNFYELDGNITQLLRRGLIKVLSYEDKSSYFITRHSSWDAIHRLYNTRNNSFMPGLLPLVKKVLNDYAKYNKKNIKIQYLTKKQKIIPIKMPNKLNGIELRPAQKAAVECAMENDTGIFSIITGFGKTILSSEIIRRCKMKTLFVVNRNELARQTHEVYKHTLGIECAKLFDGNKSTGDITIATYQTINSALKSENSAISFSMKNFLNSINLCIFDEAHTTAAQSLINISDELTNCQKRFGLTGTAFRTDGHDMKMTGVCGPIIFEYQREAIVDGYLMDPIIRFIQVNNEKRSNIKDYQEEYDEYIMNNTKRNELIKYYSNEIYKDKTILIITKLVEHARILSELLECNYITGNTDPKERKQVFDDFKSKKLRVLIGTHSIFGVGVDIPHLDIIFNVCANRGDITTLQALGRSLRKSKGKYDAMYLDFIDNSTNFLAKASRSRFNIFKKHGYSPKIIEALK